MAKPLKQTVLVFAVFLLSCALLVSRFRRSSEYSATASTSASVSAAALPPSLQSLTTAKQRPVSSNEAVSAAAPGHRMATRIRCTRAQHVHSTCLYENLYLRNGTFFAIGKPASYPREALHGGVRTHPANGSDCIRFSPTIKSLDEMKLPRPANTTVLNETYMLGCNVHSNPGHNMLDYMFPAFASLMRVGLETEDFTYIVQADKRSLWSQYAGWAKKFSGNTLTLNGMYEKCQHRTCRIRQLVTGVGGMGLTLVDDKNIPGMMRVDRAMRRFRARVYSRFGVKEYGNLSRTSTTKVVFVTNKRHVGNLTKFAQYISSHLPGVEARVVKWKDLSFPQQIEVCQTADVHIAGPGTAQMNQFLLRDGAVNIQLGRHCDFTKNRVTYFDSHITRGIDYVRALWYPSYDDDEIKSLPGQTFPVIQTQLKKEKILELVKQAIELRASRFELPVPLEVNANVYDRAYTELCKRLPLVNKFRTGEQGPKGPYGGPLCATNSPEDVLYWVRPTSSSSSIWPSKWNKRCALMTGLCNESDTPSGRTTKCIRINTAF